MRRMVVLLALVMAVTVVLFAPMAEAKKKHHHNNKRPSVPSAPVDPTPVNPAPTYNVVNCRPYVRCDGTLGNDYLKGNVAASDEIAGGEGDDVYDSKGTSNNAVGDFLADSSRTSNDSYLFPVYDFGVVLVQDRGGDSDTVDLSHYRSTDFEFTAVGIGSSNPTSLRMRGPGNRDITIQNYYFEGKIERIKFADGDLT